MTARLVRVLRYPVKSVGYEDLDKVELTPGAPLPGDRRCAILLDGAPDPLPQGWLSHRNFLRGKAAPSLMAVTTTTGTDGRVTLRHPMLSPVTLTLPQDGAALVDWLRPIWPASRPAPLRLLEGSGSFGDTPGPVLSIASLATLRALSDRVGQDLSIHRFRANLWVDGWSPRHEGDLSGHTLNVGAVQLRILDPIIRCRATSGNPATGADDIDIPRALREAWDDDSFGVYAQVVTGGTIRPGDPVTEDPR